MSKIDHLIHYKCIRVDIIAIIFNRYLNQYLTF